MVVAMIEAAIQKEEKAGLHAKETPMRKLHPPSFKKLRHEKLGVG